jgi:hypothetical protein
MHKWNEKLYNILVGKLKGRDYLRDPAGRITLE